MKEKIKVVLKQPNQKPEVKDIFVDYEFLSNYCEGLMDVVSLPTDIAVDIYCNDEFLYNGMKPNIVMPETEGVMCGPLLFAGYNPETGETIGLTDEQVKKVLTYIERNVVHNMTIESAYRYSKVLGPYQKALDDARGVQNA